LEKERKKMEEEEEREAGGERKKKMHIEGSSQITPRVSVVHGVAQLARASKLENWLTVSRKP